MLGPFGETLLVDWGLAKALGRREDDLLLEVGGQRRVVTLPSVLRRCIVRDAAVGSGELRVRFVRDEEQWASGR